MAFCRVLGGWHYDWMTLHGYQLPRGHRSLSEGIVAVRACWTFLSTPQEKLSIQINKDLLHVWVTVLLHEDKKYFVCFFLMKQRLTNRLFSNTTDHLSDSVSSLNSLFFQECYQAIIIFWCHHNCLLVGCTRHFTYTVTSNYCLYYTYILSLPLTVCTSSNIYQSYCTTCYSHLSAE